MKMSKINDDVEHDDLDDTLLSALTEASPLSSPSTFEEISSAYNVSIISRDICDLNQSMTTTATAAVSEQPNTDMLCLKSREKVEGSGDGVKQPGVATQMVTALLANAHKRPAKSDEDIDLDYGCVSRRRRMTKQQLAVEVAEAEAALLCDLGVHSIDVDFYGLPCAVRDLLLKHKGIDKLYDWQNECLRLPAIARRRNLVYSLPTSGGKTLVAEILMWREVLCRQKNTLFILPYVSIVQEKVQAMSSFAIELGFSVEEYAGSKGTIPPREHRKKRCIYIATIEKAHTLINVLIEHGRLAEIGLVVVDEFHMIGEGGCRGATLEAALTKLLFVPDRVMIVGMSATLGNMSDLSRFLDAEVYVRNFRPVELKEYVKVGNVIYSVDSSAACDDDLINKVRTCSFGYTKEMTAQDPDHLGALVLEVVPNNSCLVFCQSKKNCENVAILICKMLPAELKSFKINEKLELFETLKNDGNGRLCPVLRRTLPYGVAYHHSGLTIDERRLLEEAYSAGTLCCITCTSTLAAGVNLPAKRVIVRSPYLGAVFITHSKLKQMIGRAGRAGIDTSGESILVIQESEKKQVGELLRVKVEDCLSSLAFENNRGLKMLLLSAFGLEFIKTEDDAVNLVSKTLYSIQNIRSMDFDLKSFVKEALENLCQAGLLESRKLADTGWSTSKLGRATFKGSISLDYAQFLYDDLKIGLKALALNSYLHLLYLITPYDMIDTTKPLHNVYYDVYTSLPAVDLEVAKLIGITEACMANVVVGQKCRSVSESVLRRFYLTLVLNDLWQQNSVWDVALKYQLPRGHVQNLLTSSASFATCVLHFTKELDEMWAYQDLLNNFVKRLSHCVHPELLPLMELPCIKQGRARLLYQAGYKKLDQLAKCNPEELVSRVPHMPRKVAREIVTASKVLVLQKVDALQEEAEELISGLQ